MKFLAIVSSVLILSGCASNCQRACVFGIGPGNSAFDTVAKYHNDNDPCILTGKPEGTTRPDYCGSSRTISIYPTISPNRYIVTR